MSEKDGREYYVTELSHLMANEQRTAAEWLAADDAERADAEICPPKGLITPGYGLQVTTLTREQLQALREGKVLQIGVMAEYTVLLHLKDASATPE